MREDGLQDIVRAGKDVVVPETDYAITRPLQKSRARGVSFLAMLAAIGLDD
jgi:hypothetical protein